MTAEWERANQRKRCASKARRHLLWKLQGGKCFYCGDTVRIGTTATVDHLVPFCRGGRYAMVISCRPCNCYKGDDMPTVSEVQRFVRLLKTAHPNGLRGRKWVDKAIEECSVVARFERGALVTSP